MTKPKVLITGASGLIGGLVLRDLADRYEFSGLSRHAVPGIPYTEASVTDLDAVRRAVEGVDAVLTPMFTRRPPRVGEYDGRPAVWTFFGSVRFVPFAGPYNHTGQPAASVPAAWTADGFPVGAQLVAPRDGEPLLLSLCAQLERALRWTDRRPAMAT